MPTPEDALDAYLRRVQAAAQAKDADAALRPEALEAIAAELGLSQSDLDAAREAGAAHLARGEAFLRHGRPQDALTELAAAAALRPGEPGLLVKLAEAHLGVHQRGGDLAQLQAAQALVRRAIALDPHLAEAYTLLNRLDPPAAPAFPVSARRSSLLAGGAVLAIGLVGLAYLATRPPTPPPPAAPVAPQAPPVEAPALDADAPLTPWAGGPISPGTRKLPGRMAGGPAGLSLDLRASRLLVTGEGKGYLTLSTLLAWEGEGELEHLTAALLVRNAQGLLRQREKLDLLPSHVPPRRPGDRIHFNTTLATAPDATQLELVVQDAPLRPLVGRPSLGESFALAWEVDRPAGVTLAVSRRSEGLPAPGQGLRYAKPVFTVFNRGAVPLRHLVLELSLLNAHGDAVASRRHHAVAGEGLSLDPGSSVVAGFIMEAPPATRSMRLAVVEAE